MTATGISGMRAVEISEFLRVILDPNPNPSVRYLFTSILP